MIKFIKKEALIQHRKAMQKVRDNGKDGWRNTKRSSYNKKYYSKTAYNRNHLVLWSQEDLITILTSNKSDSILSNELGRSVAAIQIKRLRSI